MKGIELEILLEDPKKTYSPGDQLNGKLRIIVQEEQECKGLDLILSIKGSAEVNEGVTKFKLTKLDDLANKTIYQGRWSIDIYTYPFEIEIPAAPFSYQGKTIHLTWLLRAEIRPPRGESVSCQKELTVVPGKNIIVRGLPEEATEVVYKETPKSSPGCLLISLILFLGGVGATIWTLQSGKDSLMGFAIFFSISGLVILLINLYMIMIQKKIGMAEARIHSGMVTPGEIIPVSLVFQVKKNVELKGIWVTLICQERAGNVGIRASKKTYLKNLYEKRQELALPAKQVPANVPIETRGEISIPSDAPFSFHLADTFGNGIEIKWEVEFRIAMNRWPDWFCNEKITVRP